MILNKAQIADAAQAILNSRELCGNEREAFNQWASDNGIKSNDAIYRQANFRANHTWNQYQCSAGVPEKYLF